MLPRQQLPKRAGHVPATYSGFVVYFAMPRAATEDWRSMSAKKTSRSAASNLVINGRYQLAIGLSESAGTIGILSQW